MPVLDERIAERRAQVRAERRRHRLRRTLVVLGLLALVAAGYAVERSSLVALQEIQIDGTDRLAPEDVRDAAALELGTSTVRLRLGAAEDRVRELPLVRDVSIHRVDPLTVRIDVQERVPILVASGGGRRVLVDEDGVVVAGGTAPGLPEVSVDRVPTPGETVEDVPALANAHAVLTALPGPLRAVVTRYEAHSAHELDLVLDTGVRVRFGDAARVDEKARALGAVLEDLGGRQVTTIDVRAPSTPTVSP